MLLAAWLITVRILTSKLVKSIEVTRRMLGGVHRQIVASTLCEIRGALPLVGENLLDEVSSVVRRWCNLIFFKPRTGSNCRKQVLYGVPICASVLPELSQLSKAVRILVMIDHEQHVDLLEAFNQSTKSSYIWHAFVKIDVGSKRAGLPSTSHRLQDLIRRVERSLVVNIHGFYCHAGHSYACRTSDDVEEMLRAEVDNVSRAANLMSSTKPLVLSVGATPTVHILRRLQADLPPYLKLEVHAGMYSS